MLYGKLAVVFFLLLLFGSTTDVKSQRITASARHAVLLCDNGSMYSWGYNMDALLGDGTTDLRNTAVRVLSDSVFRGIFSGDAETYAVTKAGNVFVWGSIDKHAIGVPYMKYMEKTPIMVPYAKNVQQVASGGANVYFLLADGTVAVSGNSDFGQYGNGTTTQLDSGAATASITGVRSLFASAISCFAIKHDGHLMAWGSNGDRLIDSSTTITTVDMPRPILPELRFIGGCITYDLGNRGSARFVTESGDIYVWGRNTYRQLGVEGLKVLVPTKLNLSKRCTAIAGGERHTLALMEDGTVMAWGDNSTGQLGNYLVDSTTATPVQVIGLSNVVEIAAAGTASYAITKNGVLYGWGNNDYRQLNRDDAPRQYTPVDLPLPCYIVSGVEEESVAGHTTVYPNPATDELMLQMPMLVQDSGRDALVTIYALHGVMLKQSSVPMTATLHMNVADLAPGSYVVRIDIGNVLYHSTFLKLQ